MNIKEILNKLDIIQSSINDNIINELKIDIYKLHSDHTNYISKNINEIDQLQDENYKLNKQLQVLNKEYNKSRVELHIRDNIIYIKNKRIIRLIRQFNTNKKN